MRKVFFLMLLVLLVGIMPAAAQEETPPLLQMLSRIPNSALGQQNLSYVDYQAVVAARAGAAHVASWSDFDALSSSDDDSGGLFMAALNGIASGPQFLQYVLAADNIPAVMGFDFFQIERAVTFGADPTVEVVLIEGDFENAAVIAAHAARDYTTVELDGTTLLCPEAGCDQGMMLNLRNRDVSNLFGGHLGRSQPVLVGDGWIATSPNDVSLYAVNSVGESSLADQPDYRAAAEAITARGTLLQSWFIQPSSVGTVTDILAMGRLSQEQMDSIMERLESDFAPMPVYSLAVLADVITVDEQQAIIALVYYNEADAQAAAALFPDRLTHATSMRVNAPFSEVIERRGVTSTDAEVVQSGNRSVVLVTLHAPLPSSERNDDGRFTASSLPYGLLVDAYLSRDIAWLAPTLE